MSAPLRIAVIGTGNFGTLHAQTLARLAEVELTGLADDNIERALTVAKQLGVKNVVHSLDEVIQKNIADAVIIATRTDTHLSLALKAMEAGMNILIEKPMGESSREIEVFQNLIRGSKCVAMINHLCLFHSLIAPLVERVQEKGFRALHFVRHRPQAIGAYFPEEHPIRLVMIHDLYVAAQMANGEEPATFQAWNACNRTGTADMSWASLHWNDGRVATFHSHLMLPAGAPSDGWDNTEVFGEDYHTHAFTNPAPWTWTDTKISNPTSLEIANHQSIPSGMLACSLKHFVAACRGNPVPAGCRVEDGLQVQVWIEKLLSEAKSHA